MSNITPQEFLVYACATLSLGLFEWTFYSAYRDVLKRAELDPEREIWIRSLIFRVIVPFARPFAAFFSLYAERLERREMSTGQKSIFLSKKLSTLVGRRSQSALSHKRWGLSRI